ncbi:hypothetical protein HYS54_03810 [Candidatus Micrarchaeota archaeon]|nr:hypothetical protein [Candidatus Micrarchaeota archaeon]
MRLSRLFLTLVLASSALGASYEVCPSGCNFATVQAAINGAATGDTISIRPGQYNESVIVNVSYLNITGNGTYNQIIVNATNRNGVAVLNITSRYSNISNLTLTGASIGITNAANWTTAARIVVENISEQGNGNATGVHVSPYSENTSWTSVYVFNVTKPTNGNSTGDAIGFFVDEFSNNTNVSGLNVSTVVASRGGYQPVGVRVGSRNNTFSSYVNIYNVNATNTSSTDPPVDQAVGLLFNATGTTLAVPQYNTLSGPVNISFVRARAGSAYGIVFGNASYNTLSGNLNVTNITSESTGIVYGIDLSRFNSDNNTFSGDVRLVNVSSQTDNANQVEGIIISVYGTNLTGSLVIENVSGGGSLDGLTIRRGNFTRFSSPVSVTNVSATSNNAAIAIGVSIGIGANNTIFSSTVFVGGISGRGTSSSGRGVSIGGTASNVQFAGGLRLGNVTGSSSTTSIGIFVTTSNATINRLFIDGRLDASNAIEVNSQVNNVLEIANGSITATSQTNDLNFTNLIGTANLTNFTFNVNKLNIQGENTGTLREYQYVNVSVSVSGATVSVADSSGRGVTTADNGTAASTGANLLLVSTRVGGTTTASYPFTITVSRTGYITQTVSLDAAGASNSTTVELEQVASPTITAPGGSETETGQTVTGGRIAAGETKQFGFDRVSGIESVIVKAKSVISDSNVRVEVASPPITPPPSLYHGWKMEASFDRSMHDVKLRVGVLREWLLGNGIPQSNLHAYVLEGSQWKEVALTKAGEDDRKIFFTIDASTSSEYFALSGVAESKGTQPQQRQAAKQGVQTGRVTEDYLAIMLVVLTLAALSYLFVFVPRGRG